ncbi:glycosyltransferase family 2 protein [Geomonas sp.]|uniref:glycosyltransferase family 2 protein n=1 Tax=Geomonas sp. TaxID=2651584 RepID=UPI002B4854C3|nr:glycosyltransferase [Geomonas sp.]HJV34457.1 glycosyltransferase [Geomonas sp.]
MSGPKVSVLMPVYNGEKYLSQAIDSVLSQTMQDFELLVIDDGSRDRSIEIISGYHDPRLRLLVNGENLGLVKTRNKAISESVGEFVAFLDCDDIALPERLQKQRSFLEEHPDFGMVGSWIEIMDGEGVCREVMRYPAAPEEIPALLIFGNYFSQSAVMIRKSSLPAVSYRSEYPVAEDYDLWVRMATLAKVWNLPQVLTRYRVHTPSATFSKAELMESCIRKVLIEQLNLLGVTPTQQEIELHRQLGMLRFRVSADIFHEAERWLMKLIDNNHTARRFEERALQKVVARRWYMFCREGSGAGLRAWNSYRAAELARWAELSRWESCKLFVRCLIRWQRAGGVD